MKKIIVTLIGLSVFWLMLFSGHSSAVAPEDFLHAQGKALYIGKEKTRLRAINFSNFYHDPSLRLAESLHHSEVDFRRVKNLGFNAIRFAFNGNWYENDAEAFWQWLEQNIHWARKHHLYLILDLHVPIDSYWLAANSPDLSFKIWEDPQVQQRNIDLWRAIAQRYRDEPIIAAYDLLNEPVTIDSSGEQWQQLARRMVSAIRDIDQNHLLIVERLYGTEGKYSDNGALQQFLVADDNILYDFHFYEPIEYTHQYASWLAHPGGDGGNYPDADYLYPTGLAQITKPAATLSGPSPAEVHADWREYKSQRLSLPDDNLPAASPVLVLQGGGNGTVHFDDIRIFEYDAGGNFLGEALHDPIAADSSWQWSHWQSDASNPDTVQFNRHTDMGKNDAASLSITSATAGGNQLYTWNGLHQWLQVKPGHSYQLSVYIKTSGFANGAPNAYLGLNFYNRQSAHIPALARRNQAYLEQQFLKYYRFGQQNNVPVSVLETGLMHHTFTDPAKGGALWAQDMLALFSKYDTSFAWWHYHGEHMGLYLSGQQQPPANKNQALADVFTTAHMAAIDRLYAENPQSIMPASTSPPGFLSPEAVPQFVTIGFDDNTMAAGIDWAISLFAGRRNTDGSPARTSFYMNTQGLSKHIADDPNALIASVRRLPKAGHEIANHTHNHQADIDRQDWKTFEKIMARMGPQDWQHRIHQCSSDLEKLAGIPKASIKGFRAPFLRYNQNMLSALSNQGFTYDTSIEDAYSPFFDGTNMRWPYTLHEGSPAHRTGWNGSPHNPNQIILDSTPELWEFPVHVLLIPEDAIGAAYGIKPGLWERMQKKHSNLRNRRISGLDYNLFINAGLSGPEVAAILKYNLDLRLQGNRAPMMFTAHSQYYVSQEWVDTNAPHLTLQEMQGAIAEFIDYALSKPEVRMRPAIDVIEWCKKPEALAGS